VPQTFIGGMRTFYDRNATPRLWSFGANATPPLAKLLIDDESGVIRVQLRARWLRWLIPEWEAQLDSATAESFGRSVLTRGVLLRAPDHAPTIFWCRARDQQRILDAVRVHS
jgi:hypothetical protein